MTIQSHTFVITKPVGKPRTSRFDPTLPEKIVGLQFVSRTATSLTFSWTADSDADTYNVYVNTEPTPRMTGVTGTQTTLTGLSDSSTFQISVTGENVAGEGPPSDKVTMSTNAAGVEGDLSVLKAFPTAYGPGSISEGGRGGTVIYVDSLADSGAGTLREACMATGRRIVVFRVGGYIDLQTQITITNPYITIAGQTAPGDGICLRKAAGSTSWTEMLRVSTHDVVIRYIRSRPGDHADLTSGRQTDGLVVYDTAGNARRIMLDHCSVSWANDENVGLNNFGDVTMQWCLISEGLNGPTAHAKSPGHGYAIIVANIYAGTDVAFYNNLIAHNVARNPRSNASGGIASHTNNVIYNFGELSMSGNSERNYKSNLVIRGPASSTTSSRGGVPAMRWGPYEDNSIYAENNETRNASYAPEPLPSLSEEEKAALLRDTPWPEVAPMQPIADLAEMYETVLAGAGCTLPVRDSVDARVVNEVRSLTRTANAASSDMGRISNDAGVTNSFGGWPTYASGTPYTSTARDGIADAWKTTNGLDINTRYNAGPGGAAQVGPLITEAHFPGNPGWTYIELYLAGMNLPS